MDSSSVQTMMMLSWKRYYGELLYQIITMEIAAVTEMLQKGGMWHSQFSSSKVVGMIMDAPFSIPDLHMLVMNENNRADVILEALDTLHKYFPESSTSVF